ncbi:3-oxoacyl-ACP reductase FabG (plasmid) [Haloferax sp. S1W]|uniref:3-oxoacyl-ACP reductase FabG n=1 Tax=Haloferax sp. S1W TaxID=3377110 RepID=UPI0037C7854A
MTDFTGDIAVVTGGTKGIGLAVAEQLASKGATTIATYHADEEAAEEAEARLDTYDAKTAVKQFDVSDYDAVSREIDEIVDEFGAPTVLVNNAGILRNGLLVRMDPEEWQRVIDTNLNGVFYCTREVARQMLRHGGGRIVNVASIAGLTGWSGQANYAASKAGVIGFTRAVAAELRSKSIRVNAVAPGFTDTDLLEENYTTGDQQLVEEQTTTGEPATPEEVANAIVFLASTDSSYVNGEVLRIDGGLLS